MGFWNIKGHDNSEINDLRKDSDITRAIVIYFEPRYPMSLITDPSYRMDPNHVIRIYQHGSDQQTITSWTNY